MKPQFRNAAVAAVLYGAATTEAQTCGTVLQPSYPAPVVAQGWSAQLIAKGLTSPRGIQIDANGGLLVVEQNTRIRRLAFKDNGGTCLELVNNTVVVTGRLNHGIALSNDGKTLYASDAEAAYAWTYDPVAGTVSGSNRTVLRGMTNGGHVTRTLLTSQKSPGTLVASRGSDGNIDPLARDFSTGHSHIRAFNLNSPPSGGAYQYASQGTTLGWGLRNSVGIAEHPVTGGIFSVENSADNVFRQGVDIHQTNPGEELNFHGYLNGSTEHQGGNYGYPDCFSVWDPNIPNVGSLRVGNQFTPDPSATLNDTTCNQERVTPRLTFQSHTAPLDIEFSSDGSEAYVSFHGSWNRDEPAGYVLSSIAFANGQPVEPTTSTTAARPILSNPNLSACPTQCFRPVGLTIDSKGRLYMSSDSTGEIYVLQKVDPNANPGPTASGTNSIVSPSSSASPNAAPAGPLRARGGFESAVSWSLGMTVIACLLTGFGIFLA